jgi:hypothetical protein
VPDTWYAVALQVTRPILIEAFYWGIYFDPRVTFL